MNIRPLKLPDDFLRITEIATETWSYPDHPEWNVQPDEEESLADSMGNYKRIWPFVRAIQFFVPLGQEALVQAADEAGFELRAKLLTLGLLLEE